MNVCMCIHLGRWWRKSTFDHPSVLCVCVHECVCVSGAPETNRCVGFFVCDETL